MTTTPSETAVLRLALEDIVATIDTMGVDFGPDFRTSVHSDSILNSVYNRAKRALQ